MIRVVRGSKLSTAVLPRRPAYEGPIYQLDRSPCLSRSWNGFRTLLEDLEADRGTARVDQILARHQAVAELVLSRAPGGGPPEGEPLGARLSSHLTHNAAIRRPLFDAGARLLVELVEGSGGLLFVSDLRRLDWETTALLKSACRQFADRAPDLEVRFVPEPLSPAELDAHGLFWRTRPEMIARTVMGFEILPGVEVVEVAQGELPGFDDEPWPEPAPEATTPAAVAAIESSFRCFAFTAALRRGLDLLQQNPALTPRQKASVHGIMALCAHNRQFHSEGNRRLADWLQEHLEVALGHEQRADVRCALLYRLTVVLGRRKGELEAASEMADQAVSASRTSGLEPMMAAYQEGWARNIRAYVRMRRQSFDDGVRDLEEAFRALGAADSAPSTDAAWERDTALTRTLVASNIAALANLQGKREKAHHWRRVSYDIKKDAPGFEHHEAYHWLVLYRDYHLPKLGLRQVFEGLRSARAENDVYWLHRVLVMAADLNDRLGRLGSAIRLFRLAYRLRRQVGNHGLLKRTDVRSAAALSRTGDYSTARGLLVEALVDCTDKGIQADVHMAMALVAARAAHVPTTRASIRQAVDLAEESGRPDVRFRILVTAGLALQQLGLPDEARRWYRSASDLREIPRASPLCLSRALLGLLETEAPDAAMTRRCLDLVPAALKHTEGWWDLPRLLHALSRTLAAGFDVAVGERREAMETLVLAACQRRDCSEPLRQLRRVLPITATWLTKSRSRLGDPELERRAAR